MSKQPAPVIIKTSARFDIEITSPAGEEKIKITCDPNEDEYYLSINVATENHEHTITLSREGAKALLQSLQKINF